MKHLIGSAFVIARRDFVATVFSKAFLFFLLGPLFPVMLGAVFGGIGAQVASEAEQPVIAVIASPADFSRLGTARDRLADALEDAPIIRLVRFDGAADAAAQQRQLLASKSPPVLAVLTDTFSHPKLVGAVKAEGSTARQLQLIIARARAPQIEAGPEIAVTSLGRSSGRLVQERMLTARAGQFLLFFLTILLAGMLLSQLIEEKSNKVIEVLAAAVPIDAIFLGKLFAMLATSIVGIAVWSSAGAAAVAVLSEGGLANLPPPAVGWPAFFTLGRDLFRDELSAAGLGLPEHRRAGVDRARGADPVDAGDHGAGGDLRASPRWPSAHPIRRLVWPRRCSRCRRRW